MSENNVNKVGVSGSKAKIPIGKTNFTLQLGRDITQTNPFIKHLMEGGKIVKATAKGIHEKVRETVSVLLVDSKPTLIFTSKKGFGSTEVHLDIGEDKYFCNLDVILKSVKITPDCGETRIEYESQVRAFEISDNDDYLISMIPVLSTFRVVKIEQELFNLDNVIVKRQENEGQTTLGGIFGKQMKQKRINLGSHSLILMEGNGRYGVFTDGGVENLIDFSPAFISVNVNRLKMMFELESRKYTGGMVKHENDFRNILRIVASNGSNGQVSV